jgi:hypothetical protein
MLDNFWVQLGIALAVVVWIWTWKVDAPGCSGDCHQSDKRCNCREEE